MNLLILRRTALALAVALPFAANATTLEREKLKALACLEPQYSTKLGKLAWDWFGSITVERANEVSIPGKIVLDQACMANVTAAAAFGVLLVKGEVCNAGVEDFGAALLRAGVSLDSQPVPGQPQVLLSSIKGKYTFTVFKGRYIEESNTFTPGDQISFMCVHQISGPQ